MQNSRDEQALFIAAIDNLKEYARVNGGYVTKQDIEDNFGGVELEEGQLQLIYGYLLANQIKITDVDIENNEFKALLERDAEREEASKVEAEEVQDSIDYQSDDKFLTLYLDDLKAIEQVSENTEALLLVNIAENDKESLNVFIEAYLPRIVKWIEPYRRQGALASDLVQEGNLTLMTYLNDKKWLHGDLKESLKEGSMQECLDARKEIEGIIKSKVEEALKAFIESQKSSTQVNKKVLNKVNSVNDWAKRLFEEFGRKATIEEVAGKMGITIDEVKEAMDFSADNIDNIEKTY